jgi:hypothetical protein
MRYVLVLLAASIGWTAPAFAASDGNCGDRPGGPDRGVSMFSDFACGKLQLAPQLTPPAPSAAGPAPAYTVHPPSRLFKSGEPGRVRGPRAALSCHGDLLGGAHQADYNPNCRWPGNSEPGAQSAIPADDLRGRVSGPDVSQL